MNIMYMTHLRRAALLFAAAVFLCTPLSAQFRKVQEAANKVAQVLFYVDQMYVDTADVAQLAETMITKGLQSLDPHSAYIPKDEVKAMSEQIYGNFDGIGISYNIFKDTLHVIQTIPGCPAEKVGILPGDRIIRVDGRTIAGVNVRRSEIPKLLRGPRGTKVTVEIARLGETGLLPFVVERDKIPIYSVDAAYMVRPGVGYIKLNSFSVTTPKEVQEAMTRLKKEGMTSLVLDLQGNGGGVMSSAIDLSDQFLDAGKLIVYTQGEHQRRHDALASDRGAFEKGRVVVLIDEYPASASEITAGALQDWDRATVIGRRSFGKGLVQRPISLPDSAELRLTVARYYTPSGRNIQKPYTGGVEQYYKDLETRYRHGELVHADSVQFPDSLKYTTRVEHRTVYGGGGIWPDIFIPLDTTLYSLYYRKVLAKGIFMTEIARYTETNRAQLLSAYPDFSRYEKDFTVPESLMQTIVAEAGREGIPYDEEGYRQSERYMRLQIKAIVARSIYTPDTYYRVVNAMNAPLIRALELLETGQ